MRKVVVEEQAEAGDVSEESVGPSRRFVLLAWAMDWIRIFDFDFGGVEVTEERGS